ncbi:MAG: hypothetical protein ACRYGF_05480 [Janthinobacterium lividum]
MNLTLAWMRYQHHGSHDRFALIQGVTWFLISIVWVANVTTRWIFTDTALLQRRILGQGRSVAYESITSVDLTVFGKRRETAVIVYGNAGPVTYTERLTVQPENLSAFLKALKRYAPQATFHV